MVVSSVDWRGSTEAQVVHEVVHLERVSDPAQADVHASSILSKSEDGTPTPKSASSVNVTLGRDDVV